MKQFGIVLIVVLAFSAKVKAQTEQQPDIQAKQDVRALPDSLQADTLSVALHAIARELFFAVPPFQHVWHHAFRLQLRHMGAA